MIMKEQPVTIAGIARRAGVSIATVSRVLSHSRHPVNEQTRQRVLQVARELDYHPSAAARALSTQSSHTLGIAVPDLANPYYAELVHAAQEVARVLGFTVLVHDFQRDLRRLREGLETFRSQWADGVLVTGGGSSQPLDLGVLERAHVPVIVIGRHEARAPSVRVDNVEAGRLAARHLAQRGHSAVAFVQGPAELSTMQDRLDGFSQVCRAAGLALHLEPGDLKPASGYEATRRVLAKRPEVTAVCAANDSMAIGAMAACADVGVEIPRRMALSGFDDIPLASYVRPTLTTIAVPTRELGARSAGLLFSLIEGREVSDITWIEVRLMVRDSTADPGGWQ